LGTDVAETCAAGLFKRAFVRRNMNRFYRVSIMRQALLMRRTREKPCLEFYQGMQSFALLFVCADTTPEEKTLAGEDPGSMLDWQSDDP
jgi:hypothetical protein